jgi:hypothetical protein
MNKLNIYLLSYIIVFIIFQNAYFSFIQKQGINKKMDDRIKFNIENKDSIEELLRNSLEEKLKMLKTATTQNDPTKLNFQDWVKWNNKDPFITEPSDESMKYWVQVWRAIPNTDNESFQLKVYPEEEYIDHTWKDLLNYNSKQFISNHVDTDEQLIKKFFLADELPHSVFRFYWYDPVFSKTVDRKSMVYKFDDGLGNKGTISSGYTIKNITKDYTYNHYNSKEGKFLYYSSIFATVMIAIMIFYSNQVTPRLSLLKSIIFFTILMSYITYYFSQYDEYGTFDTEKSKFDGINQGILSMSFMTGISIFILTSMKNSNKEYLYNETAFLLVIVMITIIASLFKNNSYVTPGEITSLRSSKEFIFNYCLCVNLFININFGINVFF